MGSFAEALRQGALVLDGAMGTELERRGIDIARGLWSAAALLEAPEVVQQVHEAYFRAGAQVAITDTYQASIAAFQRAGESADRAVACMRLAVKLAQVARDACCPQGFVAGSVGPYGAALSDGSEYSGTYSVSDAALVDFHKPRIEALLDAGCDVLALETMPQAHEVRVLADLLEREFPQAQAWVSLSLADAEHLHDGTRLDELAAWLDGKPQILAIGANCVPVTLVKPALTTLRQVTAKPLVAYPNSGEDYDADKYAWSGLSQAPSISDELQIWLDAGARLIGGCCRTTPDDIAALAERVHAVVRPT